MTNIKSQDMDNTTREGGIRLLHQPSQTELKEAAAQISRSTKEDLQHLATPILRLMTQYDFRYACTDGSTVKPEPIATFEKSKVQKKETWVQLLALFYDEQNYDVILEGLSKQETDIWRKVVRYHFLADDEVNRIMGKDCFTHDRWSYNSRTTKLEEPLKYFFSVVNRKKDINAKGTFRQNAGFISLDNFRQHMLLKKFFSDLVSIKGRDTLPEDAGLKTYSGENVVFSKLPILASIYDNGVMGKSFAKLTAATVKKIQKTLALPDFFPTCPDKKLSLVSTALMAQFYQFFRAGQGRKKIPTEPEGLVKEIFKDTFVSNAYTLQICLPYIKGFKRSKMPYYNTNFIMILTQSLLKTHYDKGWLPVDSLIMKIRTFDPEAENKFLLFYLYDLDNLDMRNGYANDCYIHPGNIVTQISEPFVKSLMFVLSTLGIVEIAYREPAEDDTSYYDGLQYVRVTDLGKYVLEITDSYTPQISQDEKPSFELDDRRLLINVLRQDSPVVSLLTDCSVPISSSLYRVDYTSFLHGCNSRKDIEFKVDLFKRYVCANPPAVWTRFFEEIVARCDSLQPPETSYKIMRISPDDHDLQRLLLTEPSVRQYVLKAENYMIFVKTEEYKLFTLTLRKFGYLL